MIDTTVVETRDPAGGGSASRPIELSIVMPCLNETTTLGTCIRKAMKSIADASATGEVVVADNGSGDDSAVVAAELCARVVPVRQQGYGSALLGGIAAARGRYVIIGDADDSYDFGDLRPFLNKLREGYELVMGNRFAGEVKPGAMPALHRYVGNPVLSGIGRLLFHSPCHDFHCGLRGFDRAAILSLGLRCGGMEFASEMVVRATLAGLRIAEVPVTLWPDGRPGRPHLRPWRDGLRHLSFLLGTYASVRRRRRAHTGADRLLGGCHAIPSAARPMSGHDVA